MRLRHIEVFQAIREAGSISGAAKLLNITQPAVSKTLSHAESQLGFELFQRIKGKLVITAEGSLLEKEIEKVSSSVDNVRRLAEQLRHTPFQTLKIGAIPTLCNSVVPQIISHWHESFPHIACELTSFHSHELINQLFTHEIDVALSLQPSTHPGLISHSVADGSMILLAPRDLVNLPANHLPSVQPDVLSQQSFIGLLHTDPLFESINDYLTGVTPPPVVLFRVQTYALARSLAERGIGFTIVDPFTASVADQNKVVLCRLEPSCPVHCYVIRRANEPEPNFFPRLLEVIRKDAKSAIADQ